MRWQEELILWMPLGQCYISWLTTFTFYCYTDHSPAKTRGLLSPKSTSRSFISTFCRSRRDIARLGTKKWSRRPREGVIRVCRHIILTDQRKQSMCLLERKGGVFYMDWHGFFPYRGVSLISINIQRGALIRDQLRDTLVEYNH